MKHLGPIEETLSPAVTSMALNLSISNWNETLILLPGSTNWRSLSLFLNPFDPTGFTQIFLLMWNRTSDLLMQSINFRLRDYANSFSHRQRRLSYSSIDHLRGFFACVATRWNLSQRESIWPPFCPRDRKRHHVVRTTWALVNTKRASLQKYQFFALDCSFRGDIVDLNLASSFYNFYNLLTIIMQHIVHLM